jgi:hypothetical protein
MTEIFIEKFTFYTTSRVLIGTELPNYFLTISYRLPTYFPDLYGSSRAPPERYLHGEEYGVTYLPHFEITVLGVLKLQKTIPRNGELPATLCRSVA